MAEAPDDLKPIIEKLISLSGSDDIVASDLIKTLMELTIAEAFHIGEIEKEMGVYLSKE